MERDQQLSLFSPFRRSGLWRCHLLGLFFLALHLPALNDWWCWPFRSFRVAAGWRVMNNSFFHLPTTPFTLRNHNTEQRIFWQTLGRHPHCSNSFLHTTIRADNSHEGSLTTGDQGTSSLMDHETGCIGLDAGCTLNNVKYLPFHE